jgi:hypothetical protein
MTDGGAAFPYWDITFDAGGAFVEPAAVDIMTAALGTQGITDLFLFSHGWNNTEAMARNMYQTFFAEMKTLLDAPASHAPGGVKVGTAGILWPARRWDDEPLPGAGTPAAGVQQAPSDGQLVLVLKSVFTTSQQQAALDEMAQLLTDRPARQADLDRFQVLMRALNTQPDAKVTPEDSGEQSGLLDSDATLVFQRFAAQAPGTTGGGAAGLGDIFGSLWNGAKEALRATTYWQMKKRAGVVGTSGLGPLIGRFQATYPQLRIHLMGHSFGARLVSFSLLGLPDGALAPSPVKSLSLLQGAFSHFSFAAALPFDAGRGGALAGMTSRVDGPLAATHTAWDTAVGTLYPLASFLSGEDAAAQEDQFYRWGAVGHDGVQSVPAPDVPIGPVGQAYPFKTGAFVNLNGNNLIVSGGPPSGAHGDIFHPEIAWAVLQAAHLASPGGSATP